MPYRHNIDFAILKTMKLLNTICLINRLLKSYITTLYLPEDFYSRLTYLSLPFKKHVTFKSTLYVNFIFQP